MRAISFPMNVSFILLVQCLGRTLNAVDAHHGPVGLALAYIEHKSTNNLLPAGTMRDLGVELHAKYGLGLVDDSGKRRGWGLSNHVERCRLVRDLVSVRHPHLERGAKVRKQFVRKRVGVCTRRGSNLNLGETVFTVRVGFNFAAKDLSDFLSAGVI